MAGMLNSALNFLTLFFFFNNLTPLISRSKIAFSCFHNNMLLIVGNRCMEFTS